MNQTITTVKPKFIPTRPLSNVVEGLIYTRTENYSLRYTPMSCIKTNLKTEKIEDVDWMKEGF